jgi:hypothetical protein
VQLSPNFTLEEFTRSQTAKNRGISNKPLESHLANLRKLAATLEKVRALVGKGVIVTSGYRSPALNKAVGGVATSHHAQGFAADFRVHGMAAIALAKRIRDSDIAFNELILETNRGVVHMSVKPPLKREVLTQKKGPGTPTQQGIVA